MISYKKFPPLFSPHSILDDLVNLMSVSPWEGPRSASSTTVHPPLAQNPARGGDRSHVVKGGRRWGSPVRP